MSESGNIVKNVVSGVVIIGTFSLDGPTKCSGLEIKQYDEIGMKKQFEKANFKEPNAVNKWGEVAWERNLDKYKAMYTKTWNSKK